MASPYAGGKWGRAYDVNAIKAAITDGIPVWFCAPISQWNPDQYYRYPCKSAVYGYHEPTGLMAVFIAYLIEQRRNRGIYVWGAQGQRHPEITEAWIKRMETSDKNAERAIAYWQEQVEAGFGEILRAFDCSGLGMYFIQNLHHLSKSDRNAEGMRGMCIPIKRSELRAGDWVFRLNSAGKATHIGYVIDNEKHVIHAKGRDDGVIEETLTANGSTYWEWYGRPTIFDSILDPEPEPEKRDLKLENPYLRGTDVLALQKKLIYLGYELGTADGVYGAKTDVALRSFQDKAKRMTDGVCNAAMRDLLGL